MGLVGAMAGLEKRGDVGAKVHIGCNEKGGVEKTGSRGGNRTQPCHIRKPEVAQK